MDNIFHALMQAESAINTIREVQNRRLSITLGVITNTNDPQGNNRLQVNLAADGGRSTSPWYYRMVSLDNQYPPAFLLGRTAVCAYVDGNPNIGVVLGVLLNDVNKLATPQPTQFNYFVGDTSLSLDPDQGVTIKVGPYMTVVITPTTVSINGQDVTVLGGKDSRNDTLVYKGYTVNP